MSFYYGMCVCHVSISVDMAHSQQSQCVSIPLVDWMPIFIIARYALLLPKIVFVVLEKKGIRSFCCVVLSSVDHFLLLMPSCFLLKNF